MSHLRALEHESIHIIREAVAESRHAALLFSSGKDSVVLLHLVEKAFRPMNLPLSVLHIDTGHNFKEVIDFREKTQARINQTVLVGQVWESIERGTAPDPGVLGSRNAIQSITLMEMINDHKFDCLLGGARRDEEKARAKERIFSHRDPLGSWNPRRQRPEVWSLYNGRVANGDSMRVFPISNWTELDVWSYIKQEGLDLPSIYFAHDRECVIRNGKLLGVTRITPRESSEHSEITSVRYRTVGDASCTCPVKSTAKTVDEVIAETKASQISERGETRLDDQVSDHAMESRKKEGYF